MLLVKAHQKYPIALPNAPQSTKPMHEVLQDMLGIEQQDCVSVVEYENGTSYRNLWARLPLLANARL